MLLTSLTGNYWKPPALHFDCKQQGTYTQNYVQGYALIAPSSFSSINDDKVSWSQYQLDTFLTLLIKSVYKALSCTFRVVGGNAVSNEGNQLSVIISSNDCYGDCLILFHATFDVCVSLNTINLSKWFLRSATLQIFFFIAIIDD